MPPDMVFSVEEVDAYNRAQDAAAHPPAAPPPPAQAAAPAADMTFTVEEVDAATRRQSAIDNRGSNAITDGANAAGAVNDSVGAVNAGGQALQLYAQLPGGSERLLDGGRSSLRLPPSPAAPGAAPAAPSALDRASGVLGVASGAYQAVNSFRQGTAPGATQEDRNQAAFGVGIGTLGASSGVMSLAGQGGAAGGFGALAGAAETWQGVRNMSIGDVNTQGQGAQQAMHGVLSGAASLANIAGPTPVGAVLAAGSAGVSVGTAMQQRAEQVSLANGSFTRERVGRGVNGQVYNENITASEAASLRGLHMANDMSNSLYEATGNQTLADIGGGATGLLYTGANAVWNTLTNLW